MTVGRDAPTSRPSRPLQEESSPSARSRSVRVLALVEAFALRPVLWAVRFTALPRATLRKLRKK